MVPQPRNPQQEGGARARARLSTARALLLALAALAGLTALPAHALDPARRVTQYARASWSNADGLPQNTVLALAQVRGGGPLWVSTAEGLVRFDGSHFTVFDKRSVPELHSHAARALLEDARGVLWVGTEQGLVAYENGAFRRVASEGPLAHASITALAEEPGGHGALYVATSEGLGRLWLSGERFELLEGEAEAPHRGLVALLPDRRGGLWAGGWPGLFRIEGPRLQPVALKPALALAPGERAGVTALHAGRDGSLWVGTWGGLYQLRGPAQPQRVYTQADGLPTGRITSLLEDRDGNLWVGTRLGGLSRLGAGRFTTLRIAGGSADDTVNALLEDHEGNLWVGTDTSGLHRLRNGDVLVVGTQEGLSSDVVGPVLEDSHGTLWVGSRGGLDRVLRSGSVQHFGRERGLTAESVRSLAEGKDGVLWVGTLRDGAFQIDGDYVVHHTRTTGLPSDEVWTVLADSRGDVWFATSRGLTRLSGGTFRTFGPAEGVPAGPLPALLEDAEGRIWVGTMLRGLLRYDPATQSFTHFTQKDGLAADQVVELHDDGSGALWIGSGYGLTRYRYADGRFTRFTMEQGLFDDAVFRILQDDRGGFWISCNKGIYRVSRQELEEVAEGKRRQVSYTLVDQTDGMRSAECNGTSQPSGNRTRDGRLWFPTIAGLVSLDPARVHKTLTPEPQVSALRINGRPVPLAQAAHAPLEVPPGPRDLDVRFGAVNLSGADRLEYAYRLTGLEEGWREADPQHTARYVHLPPGPYRFELRVRAEGGEWREMEAPLAVRFRPHVWETTWFWVALGLSLAAALAWVLRLRVRRMRERESWLEARVEERTRELARANGVLDENLRVLRETQAQLVQAGRMAAVGTLAAGVGHEVNNPLAYILSNLDFACLEVSRLQRTLGGGRDVPALEAERAGERLAEMEQSLREALHGAERVRRIVRDLKTFSRADQDESGSVDLHAVLDSAAKMASTEVRHRARLVKRYGEVPFVQGNEARLGQVFLNLLINAAQALPEGRVGEHEIRLATSVDADGNVVAEVQDTGAGIAPEVLGRIFDPFFTTKPVGVGTGLGLSLCHAFVTAMGGRIQVESSLGRGSTFRVVLPAARAAAQAPASSEAAASSEAPRGRVLVVDDEPLVLGAMRRALGRQHEVEGVSSSRRALELLSADADAYDVVLCDLMMPEMTGMELYAEVRASHPARARRFVFISGGAFTPGAREFLEQVDCPLLEKPFDLPQLRALVQARVALVHGEGARAA
ncbi:response regulator [Aggregicoccus sp. 17bor-14]|uniref:two-component regulator propeller domain-containing protein n=1 Tax=Myxococcaceae TaxID=31 RepID=UPI00129CB5E3|nr:MULTISPECIES: two-component regulator propeller domain-containing protein [Myxococcaceae]MBF5045835.1 response regulator [Simulacricoccus sp. 17bor-14]MRI91569.1 response regulator [Aggregicoccus sp. 17bor-14]